MLHSNHPALNSYQNTTYEMATESLYTYSHDVKNPNHNTHATYYTFNHLTVDLTLITSIPNLKSATPKVHLLPKILLRTAIKLFILFVLFCFHFCNLWAQCGVLHLVWFLQNVSFSLNM